MMEVVLIGLLLVSVLLAAICVYRKERVRRKFTKDDIEKYHHTIGYYCLPPDGIRNKRDPKKVYPR